MHCHAQAWKPSRVGAGASRGGGAGRSGTEAVSDRRGSGSSRADGREVAGKARDSGPEAVAAISHPGSSPKLSARQRQGLQRQLLKGAQAQGWTTDWWTAPRVQALIQQRYGVDYHVNYIPTLLKTLGWTRQKPERRAGERDEEAIQTWFHQDWPRIKKRSAA